MNSKHHLTKRFEAENIQYKAFSAGDPSRTPLRELSRRLHTSRLAFSHWWHQSAS